MSKKRKIETVLLVLVITFVLSMVVITIYRQAPTLAVTIRSWSMEPSMTRGDLVAVLPVDCEDLSKGDKVIFRSPEAGICNWTLHRIVCDEKEDGFVTQGDANEVTDQECGMFPPIQSDWVGGVVPTINDKPVKIPLLGYIPLLIEENIYNPVFFNYYHIPCSFSDDCESRPF
ncbi:signal peptidase I [Natranaerobius trueperi]|uniref:Signal peptidase I n=1 Tax=Natranaerobius trueperi TaxID=759412 RepID=A0A226BWJ2_9FIRM|nr:signal peptidase I [Natranaerobius trueperi]OWZ83408.1 signal peptidase I [Natranaerobius trueperi]